MLQVIVYHWEETNLLGYIFDDDVAGRWMKTI